MTLRIDPLGLCLLRELTEAWEAYQETKEGIQGLPIADESSEWEWYPEHITSRREFWQRQDAYENMLADFLDHLTYMPCEAIDVSYYAALWAHMQTLPEDERDMGRLFDIAQDIGEKAIGLFKEMKSDQNSD